MGQDDFDAIVQGLDLDPDVLDLDKLPGLIFDGTHLAGLQARAEGDVARLEDLARAVNQTGTTALRRVEGDRLEVRMGDPPVVLCFIHLSALLRD